MEIILSLDIHLFDKHPEMLLVFSYGFKDDHFDDEVIPDQLNERIEWVSKKA